MDNYAHRKPSNFRREPLPRRRSWCCSFAIPPSSPQTITVASNPKSHQHHTKPDLVSKSDFNSIPNSPQSSKSALNIVGRIDPRRILSPGRVSPIDSDPIVNSIHETVPDAVNVIDSPPKSRSGSFRARKLEVSSSGLGLDMEREGGFDSRLSLKGRNGCGIVLELSSSILAANSEVFAALIAENKKDSPPPSPSPSKRVCRIEVSDVENLSVFRETVELMFDDGDAVTKKLMKIGVYRAIDVLEVAAGIQFRRVVLSCLQYLEAVPWTEEEEEKLKKLFTVYKFDDATAKDILARLYPDHSENSQQDLSRLLVRSITQCTDTSARYELKSLVKGLLSKSTVYEKELPDLDKEDLYAFCRSCVDSLVNIFKEEALSTGAGMEKKETNQNEKPLINRVSSQVENIMWLVEIMLDRHIGKDFVEFWGNQTDLVQLHERASPMIRYEISRLSAVLFIAMGTRKLHCRSELRSKLLETWFSPMLLDFGWLRRCKKGLDIRQLEEGLGQTLLTLPLKQQYKLFMEWFSMFSKKGSECPNLNKAFQVWWRRSFLRDSDRGRVESR